MKIKPYYCPHCNRFKSWWQVTNYDSFEYGDCKHCGHCAISTKEAICNLIKKQINDEQNK